ncbi:MAG: thioredoxin family protein [Bacilli bacterium]|nr:thioredoxin family protein [Bacilli bacterium]
MKKKRNGKFLFIGGIVALILSFFGLQALTNKELPVEQVLSEAFSATEAKLVYLARPDCSWCQKAKPLLNKAAKKYNFEYLYINTGKLSQDELKSVLGRFNIDINEFGTPTFVVVKNGVVVDSNIGYMEENDLIYFLKNTEVIKAKGSEE